MRRIKRILASGRARWLAPGLLLAAAAMLGGGYALVSANATDESQARPAKQAVDYRPQLLRDDTPDVPRDDESDSPGDEAPEPDEPTSDGTGDSSPSDLDEERCRPVDDMNDLTDGSVPSPEELLPDPARCPEFYEGRNGSSGSAPPVSGVPPVPGYTPNGVPVAPPYTPKPAPEPPPPPGLDPDEYRLGDPTPQTNDPTPGLPPGTQPDY